MRKPKVWGWRFSQYFWETNNIVFCLHPVVPNPHVLVTSIPIETKFFTEIHPCSSFLSFFFFFLKIFFIHSWETQRDRERGRDTGRGRSRHYTESLTCDSIQGLQDHTLGCRRHQTAAPPGAALCSSFLSIPVDKGSQFLFAFTSEEWQYTNNASRLHGRSFLFVTNLKG